MGGALISSRFRTTVNGFGRNHSCFCSGYRDMGDTTMIPLTSDLTMEFQYPQFLSEEALKSSC
jgi:hypothetical protein